MLQSDGSAVFHLKYPLKPNSLIFGATSVQSPLPPPICQHSHQSKPPPTFRRDGATVGNRCMGGYTGWLYGLAVGALAVGAAREPPYSSHRDIAFLFKAKQL
jgi:hypothetical protein